MPLLPLQEPFLPEPNEKVLRERVEEEVLSVALSDDAGRGGAHWEVDWRGSMVLLGPTTPATVLEPVWGGGRQTHGESASGEHLEAAEEENLRFVR